MPCTGLWFNRPPGIRPCPLYTPPVALTDGLLCEFEGLASGYFFISFQLIKYNLFFGAMETHAHTRPHLPPACHGQSK